MNNIGFKQVIGGVSIMFSILFLLAMAGNLQGLKHSSTRVFQELDTELAKPIEPVDEMDNPPAPDSVISGSFNPETPGNLVTQPDKKSSAIFHYKAIPSDRLKSDGAKPELKLEVEENGQKSWISTQWSWIDYDQGILYFHFMTEENGQTKTVKNFTGNYQLLF